MTLPWTFSKESDNPICKLERWTAPSGSYYHVWLLSNWNVIYLNWSCYRYEIYKLYCKHLIWKKIFQKRYLNDYYVLKWHFRYIDLENIIKISFTCFLLLFKCSLWKVLLHMLLPLYSYWMLIYKIHLSLKHKRLLNISIFLTSKK